MRISAYGKQRIINLEEKFNLTIIEIQYRLLEEDNINISRQAFSNFIQRYQRSGAAYGGGRRPALNVKQLILANYTLYTVPGYCTCSNNIIANADHTLLHVPARAHSSLLTSSLDNVKW